MREHGGAATGCEEKSRLASREKREETRETKLGVVRVVPIR